METKKKQGTNAFGAWGWGLIIYVALMYMFGTGLVNDGLNVIVPAVAEKSGLDVQTLLGWSTPAGWVAVIGGFIAGNLIKKTGAKKILVAGLLITGIAVCFWGNITSVWQYAVVIVILSVMDTVQVGLASNAVVANWFPRKKGVVMGLVTIGAVLGSTVFIFGLNALNKAVTITGSLYVIGGLVIVLALVGVWLIKNNPEERGVNPDNDKSLSAADVAAMHAEGLEHAKNSSFTIGKLFKTKQMWQIVVIYGCIMLATTGIMSQFVLRYVDLGMTFDGAVNLITILGVVIAPASYIWGIVDFKLGPRKASMGLIAWYIVAIVLNLMPIKALVYVSAVMIAAGLGGAANFLTSMITSVFGRYDFINANRVIYPLTMFLKASGFAVVSLLVTKTGGYTIPYIVIAVILAVALVVAAIFRDDFIGAGEKE